MKRCIPVRLQALAGLAAGAVLMTAFAACAGDSQSDAPTAGRQQAQRQEQQATAEYEQRDAQYYEQQAAVEYAQEEAAPVAAAKQTSISTSASPPRQTPAPHSTTFRDNPRALFAVTAEDAASTFSLDVDRTSYRLALNWAGEGIAVDPDSVRAEEWINAFDYRYERPSGDRFFAIVSDVARHPLDDGLRLARIGFQAPEPPDDTLLNVTLVLDASGSMADGGRVNIARAAAEQIRAGLGDRDRIAVVQFSSDIVRELTVANARPSDRAVSDSIRRLSPRDSTNVQAGLDLGVQLAAEMRRARPDAYHYIILMSDGVANVDAADPFAILERVGEPRDRDANPLRLITVGVGIANYNDYLLEQLAQHGNGWYRYLSTTQEARDVFSRENWLALSRPFADQTRAQVVWDADMVRSWRMIGYENRTTSDESFNEDRREFAEIPAGAATTVFFELQLTAAARQAGGDLQLGRVELRWLTPSEREARSQQSAVVGAAAGDLRDESSALLQFGALVALAADRYSGLARTDSEQARTVRQELELLSAELGGLDEALGLINAYSDFRFLLSRLISALPEGGGSGYSR